MWLNLRRFLCKNKDDEGNVNMFEVQTSAVKYLQSHTRQSTVNHSKNLVK